MRRSGWGVCGVVLYACVNVCLQGERAVWPRPSSRAIHVPVLHHAMCFVAAHYGAGQESQLLFVPIRPVWPATNKTNTSVSDTSESDDGHMLRGAIAIANEGLRICLQRTDFSLVSGLTKYLRFKVDFRLISSGPRGMLEDIPITVSLFTQIEP